MSEQSVLMDIDSSIALISLNRPQKHNAINKDLLVQLYDCFESVSTRPDINAVILTGKGKSFCAGVDLEAVKTQGLFDIREDGKELPEIFKACPVPIIGAVNGHAITGGLEMALCCDFLIASDLAVFIDSHAKLGIHPGWGLTQLLQQAVGIRRAAQMSFTGMPVPVGLALEWGLVNEVVPAKDLVPRAKAIAGQIGEASPAIIKKIKSLMNCSGQMSREQALDLERKGFKQFLNDPESLGDSAF